MNHFEKKESQPKPAVFLLDTFFFIILDSVFLQLVKKNQNCSLEHLWKEIHSLKYHLCQFISVLARL